MTSRSCGPCTACCTLMGVEEINKAIYTRCDKLCASGCSIYADRPPSCADFACAWLVEQEGLLRNMERPDQVGVMLDITEPDAELGQALIAREVRKGAFDEDAAKSMLKRLSKRGLIVLQREMSGVMEHGCVGPEHLVRKAKMQKHV